MAESIDIAAPPVEHRSVIHARGGYIPIPIVALRLAPDRPFDLYTVRHAGGERRYVLYRSRRTRLTHATLNRLRENGIQFLYIQTAAHREYTQFLEAHLSAAMQDPTLSDREQTEILYQTAVRLLEEIFAEPDDLHQIRRVVPIVDHIATRVLADRMAMTHLAALHRHDHYLATHSVNVAGYMAALGVAGGICDSNALREVALGGLLHDLGKLRIPREVLNKTGRLSEDEWAMMRRHPDDSVALASEHMTLTLPVKSILRDHHEWISGAGYPRGLRGEAIHPYARVASICDVFDALTSFRSYNRLQTAEQALETMEREVTKQFDASWFATWQRLVRGNVDVDHWPVEARATAPVDEVVRPRVQAPRAERRYHDRHPYRAAVVLRDLRDGPAVRVAPIAHTIDLSRSGMRVITAHPFAPGDRLQVVLPDGPQLARPLVSRVVRCEPGRRPGEYVAALQFERTQERLVGDSPPPKLVR